MATDQQLNEIKEFLRRSYIRTMRKDIKMLREADIKKERGKIADLSLNKNEEKPPERLINKKSEEQAINKEELKKTQIETILQRNLKEEEESRKIVEQHANEEERQRIFVIKSDIKALEKSIEAINQKEEPPVLLEKNRLLLQEKKLQQSIREISQREENLKNQERVIEEQIGQTETPSHKKNLQTRSVELERDQKNMEKERWVAERDLSILQKKLQDIDQELKKMHEKENGLRGKINILKDDLKKYYFKVASREKEDLEKNKEKAPLPYQEKPSLHNREKSITTEQMKKNTLYETTKESKPQEKKTRNETVPSVIERVAASSSVEEKWRKKFMEDIEAWAQQK